LPLPFTFDLEYAKISLGD